jgi:hypothetical protein
MCGLTAPDEPVELPRGAEEYRPSGVRAAVLISQTELTWTIAFAAIPSFH